MDPEDLEKGLPIGGFRIKAQRDARPYQKGSSPLPKGVYYPLGNNEFENDKTLRISSS
jgi:hypothetical protein